MGSSGRSSPLSTWWEGGWKESFFHSENQSFGNQEKKATWLNKRNLSERTNYLHLNKIQDDDDDYSPLPCAPYPQSFFNPIVFQEARSILQEIRKIQEIEKIQSLWECLITIILSFSWMFTKRSIYFCVKTCAVPTQADWRSVTCDLSNLSQKWSVRKPRIPQNNNKWKERR